MVIEGSYLERSYHSDSVARDGLEIDFVSEHRPLEAYTEALTAAGLVIERLRPPALPEHALARAHSGRWQRLPLFLHLRAKGAGVRLKPDAVVGSRRLNPRPGSR